MTRKNTLERLKAEKSYNEYNKKRLKFKRALKCPKCGEKLVLFDDGIRCKHCGYSDKPENMNK